MSEERRGEQEERYNECRFDEEEDIFRYFKKDLFPATQVATDESDWQELTPFDIILKGFKVKSSAPVSFKYNKCEEEGGGRRKDRSKRERGERKDRKSKCI